MKKKLGRSPLDAFLSKPKKTANGESSQPQATTPQGELRKLPIEFYAAGSISAAKDND